MQSFLPQPVDVSRPDGYWIEVFPFRANDSRAPNIIGYGLGTADRTSKIEMYLNPYNLANSSVSAAGVVGWERKHLAELRFPVACSYADISGNGYNDVIISDEYGPSMNEIWSDGGRVSWLENTGNASKANWTRRYIGRSPGMHRLKAGHFTRTDIVQIVAVPIIVKSSDLGSPAPIIIYTAPTDPTKVDSPHCEVGWPCEVAFTDVFRLVHEVSIVPSSDGGLDKILLAGRDGISILWYNSKAQTWKYEIIGSGLPASNCNPYWGSGSVDLATVHDDHSGYIACSEAFHGNHVSVYVKAEDDPVNELVGLKWTRHVLADFGPLNEEHTGSIHHVICADIDGDGVEETLVALMGSDPPLWEKTGVWCFKPIDLQNGRFARFKLSDSSAGRIAVGEFTSRGVLDFATISYSVPGYFESPNPSINMYANSPILAEKIHDEILFRVPRPSSNHLADEVEFLDVASRKLSLVLVPPDRKYHVNNGDGIKVIAGRVTWTDHDGIFCQRTQAASPFEQISMIIETRVDDCYVYTQSEGAIFLLFMQSSNSGHLPYCDMKQLIAHNILPDHFPVNICHMNFPWIKVEDRPWANGKFKGLEFYNLSGFHVRYADDSDETLCHIQLWTAGAKVSAGFHNHIGQTFCEIHACIVNGTGQGGMKWAIVDDGDFDPANPDESKYQSLVVPDMSEHGPLWRTIRDGLPALRSNGTVDYPWYGEGDIEEQSFDVWVAFEFPPFISHVGGMGIRVASPEPGRFFRVWNPMLKLAAAVQDDSSADGTPITTTRPSGEKKQLWEFLIIPGTRFYALRNVASGSLASVAWPPIAGQKLVTSRSLAILGITASWILMPVNRDTYQIRLMGTDLVWARDRDNEQVVLRKCNADEGRVRWSINEFQ